MPGPPIGAIVEIVGPTPRRARVLETRPGQSRCELGDGRSVWIPWKKLKPAPKGASLDVDPVAVAARESTRPSAGPEPAAGSHTGWLAAAVGLTLVSAALSTVALNTWDAPKAVVFAVALAASCLVPGLVFGVLALFPRNRTVRSAAQIFVAFGVLGVLAGMNEVRKQYLTGNSEALSSRIERQLKEVQENEAAKRIGFQEAEEKRLVILRWAANKSEGRDLPYFRVLARMQQPIALLAREEAAARAKVESETLPYRVGDVKTKDDLNRVRGDIDRYADVSSRLVEHYKTAVARYDEEMRKNGVQEMLRDAGRRDVARTATERGALYSNLSSRLEIHQQVMKLLESEWGHWSHDNWTSKVDFDREAPRKEYEQLAAKYATLGGKEAEAVARPSPRPGSLGNLAEPSLPPTPGSTAPTPVHAATPPPDVPPPAPPPAPAAPAVP